MVIHFYRPEARCQKVKLWQLSDNFLLSFVILVLHLDLEKMCFVDFDRNTRVTPEAQTFTSYIRETDTPQSINEL